MYQKKVKIGLLGGSFNPAHEGHLHVSKIACQKLGVKQVWWIVSPQNPHKKPYKASFYERIEQSRKIAEKTPYIKVSALELELFGLKSRYYTINLIKRLKSRYKNYEFYFILGADNLTGFQKWHKWKNLLNEMQFICIDREGNRYKRLSSKAYRTGKIKFIEAPLVNISSTDLRKDQSLET